MKPRSLADPVRFRTGHVAPNRIVLAPLTNQLSGADGKVLRAEIAWLAMRAKGGYGIVTTAAAAVSADGRAFPGQLGLFEDAQLDGLARLASAAKSRGGLAIAQLLHGGPRALFDPIGFGAESPVRPAGALELHRIVMAFGDAAKRAQQAGFDGVQLHAAYGFLHSALLAHDLYAGEAYVRETLAAIRASTGDEFVISLRLNLEGYGQEDGRTLALAQALLADAVIDHLDLVVEALPTEPVDLAAGEAIVQLTGRVTDWYSAHYLLAAGAVVLGVGTAAVLHEDFAARIVADPAFRALSLPANAAHLARNGVTGRFLDYLRKWPGFVGLEGEAA